jgi:predicted RNA-binding protein Jag
MVGFMKSALNLFGLNKKEGEGSTEGGVHLDEFLSELPQKMGFDVSFKKKDTSEPGVHFEVEGSEVDSFLGENCEMLDALSHVAMRVLRRNEGVSNTPIEEGQETIFRVTFDAGGFRDKKSAELKELAATQRQRVIESGGKPSYVRALGPSERKIIHTALADLGEVTSESIGRGNFKRIRIRLKDDSTFRRAPTAEGNEQAAEGANNPQQRRPQFNAGGGNRGPRREGGQGQNRGGGNRGPRREGGQGQNRGPRRPQHHNDSEINGNVAPDLNMYQQEDDNRGNRLAPGESSPYYNPNNSGNK